MLRQDSRRSPPKKLAAASELLELDWRNSFESLSSVAGELPWSTFSDSRWICRCPDRSLSDLCRRLRLQMTSIIKTKTSIGFDDFHERKIPSRDLSKPSEHDQMGESCCRMTRKRLMKLADLAGRLKRKSSIGHNQIGFSCSLQLHESLPYEVELQTNRMNEFLVKQLNKVAQEDLEQLNSMDEKDSEDEDEILFVNLPPERNRIPPLTSSSSLSSSASSRHSISLSSSGDSGISLIVQASETPENQETGRDEEQNRKRRTKFRIRYRLERHFELKSSRQFAEIVAFSWQFFTELLHENSLLELDFSNQSLTLNQLKVFARVECQKLRAKLRFHWLAKCLWIAFNEPGKVSPARLLPPLQQDNSSTSQRPTSAFTCYLDALARLMANVLRRHYLEEALGRFICTLERHLHVRRPTGMMKLSLKLELEADGTGANEVVSSRPEEQLKEALAFVMDEISWTCRELPRVECQQLDGPLGEASNIRVLSQDDRLIELSREEMDKLVELLIGDPGRGGLDQGNCSRMLNASHLNLIAIINKFWISPGELEVAARQSDELPEDPKSNSPLAFEAVALAGFELLKPGEGNKKLALVEQLEATWRQIDLLDRLEFELKCKLVTDSTFGQLVALDLTEFNESLAKILQRERLLLIRVKSDELFKLLEATRKQMNELELNTDLETAVEDYLLERQRVRQSLPSNLEHQILLDEMPRAEEAELDQAAAASASDDWAQAGAAPGGNEGEVFEEVDEEEELLNALVNQNNPRADHLFAEADVSGEVLDEAGSAQRHAQVAPLIESRLLLERYKYLSNFLLNDLDSFEAQLGFVLLQGIPFLCQFNWLQNWHPNETSSGRLARESGFEPEQLELVVEISLRAREFGLVLKESLGRLARAHSRLLSSIETRATILNKSLIEFDWLMWKLAECLLESSSDEAANIKQLGLIQSTSAWSKRLHLRLDFLSCQIELIQRESRLLLVECQLEFGLFDRFRSDCQLQPPKTPSEAAEMIRSVEEESEWREGTLARWRTPATLLATFWSLTEEFEMQQVKWLNSDSKRLDYKLIRSSFELRFLNKLDELRGQANSMPSADFHNQASPSQPKAALLNNIRELETRLERFRCLCLPILKFLSNEHLQAEHWLKLQRLLADRLSDQSQPEIYTTLAQLLELGINEELAEKLDRMSHEATIEHELSLLIEAEIERQGERLLTNSNARGSRQRLKSELASVEAIQLLDSWNENELRLAAGRFIRTRWQLVRGLSGEEQTLIDELTRKLIACHLAVRRLVQLGGQLNLELSLGRSGPGDTGASGKVSSSKRRTNKFGTLFVRSRLTSASSSEQVNSLLLVEFLRLFTESWIESEQLLSKRASKVSSALDNTRVHLAEIGQLLDEVGQIRARDSKLAVERNELELARLQQSSLGLELERELLATSESSSLELQAATLGRRNECIKQISGRAIPAIRAACRALDCLGDGRSLRALRSYRPSPPLAIRLVIEAVCLLRNVCCRLPRASGSSVELVDDLQLGERRLTSTLVEMGVVESKGKQRMNDNRDKRQRLRPIEAVRHYDQVRDRIVEDYWQTAWRTLNGTHSGQFVADLRRISQGTRIPGTTMAVIRRRYLSRKEFSLATVERHSKAASQLARWLLAVDVFERVMSVVRPNYDEYLEAERALAGALTEVARRRSQIELIGRELQQNEELIGCQVDERARLVELIEDCRQGSSELSETRNELVAREHELVTKLHRIRSKLRELPGRSLATGAKLVYLDAIATCDRPIVERILASKLGSISLE